MNFIVDTFCNLRRFDDAYKLMDSFSPTVFTFGTILHHLFKQKEYLHALKIVDIAKENNVQLNTYTYNIIAACYWNLNQPEKAKGIVGVMRNNFVSPDVFTFNYGIAFFKKRGAYEEAIDLFQQIAVNDLKPDEASYNFEEMLKHNIPIGTDVRNVFILHYKDTKQFAKLDHVTNLKPSQKPSK